MKTNAELDNDILQRERPKTWRDYCVGASFLQQMQFDPVRFMVPGLIPEGVNLLVGKPKIGKSWWALDLAIASADGQRYTLGDLKPRHGDCIYLALEDNKRRLKKRISKLLPDSWAWPKRLTLVNEWRRSNEGGINDLREWCSGVEKPTLIIIDTLQKFRPLPKGSDTYASDYGAITELLSLTKAFPGLCILVLHHDRKMTADDPFDTVSGTLGITGAADTILILKRDNGSVKLHVRGRDVEESETPLRFEKATCKWTKLTAEDAEAALSSQRRAILEVLPPAPDVMSIADIRSATGRDERDAAIRKMLLDMKIAGQVVSTRPGFYSRPGNASNAVTEGSVTDPVTHQPTDITTETASVTDVTSVTGPVTRGVTAGDLGVSRRHKCFQCDQRGETIEVSYRGALGRVHVHCSEAWKAGVDDRSGPPEDDPAEWSEARLNAEMPLPTDDFPEMPENLKRVRA